MKLHPGDHEVKCRNHGCQNMGFIPKKSRTSLCPACSKAQGGPQSKFRSTIGKAEAARRMCKRMHQATQEKAVEKHRAIALEHPLALPEERAAYNATLKALIKKPVPEGQAFTHTHLGKSLICLCNCGIIKNCADYPIQVVMVMLFLLGSFNMRIGDVVGVPVETLVRAYYVRTELEKKFPGQVDPWAFVPWGALDKDGYTGFPRYISIECKDSEASKYDKAKKPTHVRRASIMSETDAPLPPALLRPTKDALGIVRHGVVNSRGKVVVAFAVEINGVPDVVELLMWRRQATLRDIEKWTQADFDNFNALLTEESIYDVVDTGMSRKEAVAQVERFYQAYKLAFEAVHAALLARFKGKMPPIKALAGFLNAARYEIPTFRRLRDDAPEDDIAAMGREIENMAKEVVTRAETHRFNRVALDAVDVMKVTTGRLGGAGGAEPAAPAGDDAAPTAAAGADDEQQEEEAPPADEEQEEQAAAPAPANNGGGGDDNGANGGGGDDDDEENSVFPEPDGDDAAGLPPAPAPAPPKTCKKARVAGRSDKMRRMTSGLAADFRTMQSATGLEATTLSQTQG